MKLNNKGFAVSSVLYSMLILFLAIVLVILMILASSKFTYNTVRNQILDDLNITTSSDTLTYKTGDLVFYNPVTKEACDYINSYDYLGTGTCYLFYAIADSPVSEANVSLIMNRNLLPGTWDADGNVNWYVSNTNTVGPLTALNSLKDGTTDWTNDELNYNYVNTGNSGSNGYNKLLVADNSWGLFSNGNNTEVPNNTINDLKVRMLTLEEAAALGCTTSNASCNTFLYDNIGTSYYWLLTSNAASATNVYVINNNGGYTSASVTASYGIRPVIEIDKRSLLVCDTNGICASSNPSAPALVSSDAGIDEIIATYSESTDASGIKNYECYYGTNASNLKSKGTISGLVCTMSDLNTTTTYYYMMCSINNLDRTTCSTISSTQTIVPVSSFAYTGAMQTYEVPANGTYKVELWGASGNTWKTASNPGYGSYVSGQIYLTAGTNLYLYVGSNATAFNGGSIGGQTTGTEIGGGATDVRLTSGTWNDVTSLRSRIMVAAAGGGTGEGSGKGGDAGGLIGNSGATAYSGSGATQLAGGTGGANGTMSGITGTFGAGGNGGLETSYGYGGSGSSGYYGGGGGAGVGGVDGAGGSGSSYISGHTGAVAVVSSSSTSARTGTGGVACTTGITDNLCSIHYSGKYFMATKMIDGSGYVWTNTKGSLQTMPNPSGGYYSSGVGHSGTGYAKITYLGVQFDFAYTGSYQTVTIPTTGSYQIESWGAAGGGDNGTDSGAGKGAYTSGLIYLSSGTNLYVYSGGRGGNNTFSSTQGIGGYNGGGIGGLGTLPGAGAGAGGGGATHIATSSGLLSTLSSNQSSILMVAGGGGGNGRTGGGAGGGTSGGYGGSPTGIYGTAGGNATAITGGGGGAGGYYGIGGTGGGTGGGVGGTAYSTNTSPGSSGSFGLGGAGGGVTTTNSDGGGGGAGGYYGGGGGGGGAGGSSGGGGGGASYVKASFTNVSIIAGNASMPSISGSTEIGHLDSGYARITFINQ